MTAKITINIDDHVFEFLNQVTNNRSAYINNLLLEKEREQLQEKLRQAYREQNQDLNQLDKERGLHINQIRSIDSSRLKSKLGTLESSYFGHIKKALDIQFGFF